MKRVLGLNPSAIRYSTNPLCLSSLNMDIISVDSPSPRISGEIV